MLYDFLIIAILIRLSIVDWTDFTIPNWSVLAILLIKSIQVYPDYRWQLIILPLCLFALLFAIDHWYFLKKGQTGLGTGDIKLLTVLSIGLNAFDVALLIWLSSLLALLALKLTRLHQEKVPYGVYISIAYFGLLAGFSSFFAEQLI